MSCLSRHQCNKKKVITSHEKLGLPGHITIHDTTVRERFQREERLIPSDAKLDVEFPAVTINQKTVDRTLAVHRQEAGASDLNPFIPAELQNKKRHPLKARL